MGASSSSLPFRDREMLSRAGHIRKPNGGLRIAPGQGIDRIGGALHSFAMAHDQESDMSATGRQMHLGVFVLGTGNHIAGWRTEGAFASHLDFGVMREIARIAERGKFDLLFISDSMAMDPTDHPSFMCRFEPTSLITAPIACTTHIGLGATVSSSFSGPYNVARLFSSIDHLSGGRAAWNVVTSSNPKAALNFNLDQHLEHEFRYARAEEFVDVVLGLWDCWDEGAIVADKAAGRFIDDGSISVTITIYSFNIPINLIRSSGFAEKSPYLQL
jgi:hypothetical protein